MRNLRTEDEIIANWQGDINKPVVSICCITYNHEPYIEDALEGFLIQETDFPFEILIHDDASTDNTADIIREYEAKYPKLIKPIYQTENQYKKGNKPSNIIYPFAKGDFLAICEGDDYWINTGKLQLQFNSLIFNDVDMCIHMASNIDYESGEKKTIGEYSNTNNTIPIENIIDKKFGQIPTASTFIRRTAFERYIKFRNKNKWLTVGDIYLHFFGGVRSGVFFINKVMSVYRSNTPGSWTSKVKTNNEHKINHLKMRIISYDILNLESNYKYNTSFSNQNEITALALITSDIGYINRIDILLKNIKRFSIKNKVKAIIISLFPFLISFYRKIKLIKNQIQTK